MAADILTRVKLAIRRTHSKLDDDLQADIDACLQDMKMRGIKKPDPSNSLVFAAIKLYCRSTTAGDPAKAVAFHQRYEALRDAMALSGDYNQSATEDSHG